MVFELRTINEILELNPPTKLAKGTIAKKVAMEHITENQKYINKFHVTEFKGGSKFKNNDVLVARITPCLENGKTAFVDILEEAEVAFGSTEYFVIRNIPNITDSHYLYYLMRTPIIRETLIKSMTGTSGRQRAQKESLLDFQFSIPSLQEQIKIAKTLSNIDDKIRLNQQTIANLEELSQTLFKRWFIDFEFPNEKGNSYKSSRGEFIKSEIGDIPVGWQSQKANEIYTINIGKTPPRKLRHLFSESDGKKWVSISDMKQEGPYIFDTKEYLISEAIKEYRVRVAPKNSVLFSFKLTLGRVKIANESLTTNEAIAHFIENDNTPPYLYTYLYLKNFNYHLLGNTSSIATAVNSKIIKAMPILIPDEEVLSKFYEMLKPVFESIKEHQNQTNNLVELRDTLLPKLMSGEIELPNDLEVEAHAELLQ